MTKKIMAVIVILVITIIITIFGLIFTSYSNDNQQHSTKINDLTTIITKGKWIKTLGSGPFTETYTYIFYQNNTFLESYASDVFSNSKGNWSLIIDGEETVHLVLDGGFGYWLPNDTIISYDKSNDTLLITGPSIVGMQYLEHDMFQ
jgi:type II secretory pathway pseudopilin PulG